MRIVRLLVVVALTAALPIVAGPAVADAPAATYTAFTVATGGEGYVVDPGSDVVLTPSTATFQVTGTAATSITLTATEPAVGGQSAPRFAVTLAPPTGATLTAGNSYPTAYQSPTLSAAALTVTGPGSTCTSETDGTVTVAELTSNEDGSVATLAADYSFGCTGIASLISGEIRWQAGTGFRGTAISPSDFDFGDQVVNTASPAQTFTVTESGTAANSFGAASITGSNSSAFAIKPGSDHCSNSQVAGASTCTIAVYAKPTTTGSVQAQLQLPAATAGDEAQYVPLQAHGVAAATFTVTAGPGVVDLTIGQVPNAPLDDAGTTIERGSSPSSLAAYSGVVSNHDGTYTDTGITPGKSYYYDVYTPTKSGVTVIHTAAIGVVPWARGGAGAYYPRSDGIVLNTQKGTGAPKRKLAARATISVQVAGHAVVPVGGAEAVVLDVLATHAAKATALAIYATGTPLPVWSMYVPVGATVSHEVTVRLSSAGKINITNYLGAVDVTAEVVGFYANSTLSAPTWGNGGQLQGLPTTPLFDTRVKGAHALPGGYFEQIPIGFTDAIAQHVTAVVLSVTAIGGASSGKLDAWDAETGPPPANDLVTWSAHTVTTNTLVVPSSEVYSSYFGEYVPTVAIANSSNASVGLIVSLVGFYDDDSLPFGLRFHPAAPARLANSATHLVLTHALGAKATAVLDPKSHADANTEGLELNVTTEDPSTGTDIVSWPVGLSGFPRPAYPNMYAAKKIVQADEGVSYVGVANRFNVYNAAGTTNVAIDLIGTFEAWPALTGAGSAVASDASSPVSSALRPAVAGSLRSAVVRASHASG